MRQGCGCSQVVGIQANVSKEACFLQSHTPYLSALSHPASVYSFPAL